MGPLYSIEGVRVCANCAFNVNRWCRGKGSPREGKLNVNDRTDTCSKHRYLREVRP